MQERNRFMLDPTRSLTVALAVAIAGCAGISGHQVVQNRVVVSGGAVANG